MSRVPWALAVRLMAVALPLAAQDPAELFEKAPPAVDKALRARITHFFQAHIDGKPRLADLDVAEDSKDFFFASNKPKYLACEIIKIAYTANFDKATVTTVCDTYVMMPGFEGKPMKFAAASLWKIIDGQWFWYIEQLKETQTPFGIMKATEGPATAAPPSPLGAMSKGPTVDSLRSQVKADRDSVRLKAGAAGTADFRITNALPGPVQLTLRDPNLKGLALKLDRTSLNGNETAVLSVAAAASFAPPQDAVRVLVEVQPLNHQLWFELIFAQ